MSLIWTEEEKNSLSFLNHLMFDIHHKSAELPWFIQHLLDMLLKDSVRQNSISQHAGLFSGYLLDEELIWRFLLRLEQEKARSGPELYGKP